MRVHGLPPEAANETHEAWVQRIHQDDRQRTEQHFREVVAGSATDYEAEYRIVRPSDGQVRWILAKAEIERDA
ncbi:PAS domain-containing protein, partial [Stenotrophomonas maltophilia]|uniref:PAS domain-containing protein n=2 Tax=Bacteria TaxID=2 RepID=UPI003D18AF05